MSWGNRTMIVVRYGEGDLPRSVQYSRLSILDRVVAVRSSLTAYIVFSSIRVGLIAAVLDGGPDRPGDSAADLLCPMQEPQPAVWNPLWRRYVPLSIVHLRDLRFRALYSTLFFYQVVSTIDDLMIVTFSIRCGALRAGRHIRSGRNLSAISTSKRRSLRGRHSDRRRCSCMRPEPHHCRHGLESSRLHPGIDSSSPSPAASCRSHPPH
jgi:hypothetical protein